MRFMATGCTDVGRIKETNQDSYLIKIAQTDFGDVALVAVADGMGGLAKGELASATVVRRLSEWFETKLPQSLEAMGASVDGFEQFVEGQWNGLVQDLNLMIMRHGKSEGMNLGTTLTAMLCIGARYSIVHVGDSRAYEITTGGISQLPEDQTFVKREVDAGRMTPEEALVHPQRNVLLQCIGSSKEVKPVIAHGTLTRGAAYLLCSDGFRHVLTNDELRETLGPDRLDWAGEGDPQNEAAPSNVLRRTINLVMSRKENDNITAVLLQTMEGGR